MTSTTTDLTTDLRIACPAWCGEKPGHVLRDARIAIGNSDDDDVYTLEHEHSGPTFITGSGKFPVSVGGTWSAGTWYFDISLADIEFNQSNMLDEDEARELFTNLQSALAWIEEHR